MDQNKKITDPEHHLYFYATLFFIVLHYPEGTETPYVF